MDTSRTGIPPRAGIPPLNPKWVFAPLGIVIGAVLWTIGARYTIDGLVVVANALLSWLALPEAVRIPALAWQWWHVALWTVPVVCSVAEWLSPRRLANWMRVLWAGILLADLVSTFIGIGLPDAYTPANIAFVGLVTLLLTFGPEWLMKNGWGTLRR